MTVKSLRGVKNTNKKKKQAGVGFSVEGRGGGAWFVQAVQISGMHFYADI